MRVFDIIKNKRDGKKLSKTEIDYIVSEYTKGNIPDYQISALLMAIYYKGMSVDEICNLTFAIRDSGDKLDFSNIKGVKVDKHSTGGVGDKTSLIIAPIVASLGVKVAKMSGRGLGHTGGTIDKLESIPNFNTSLSESEFIKIVNEIGVAIISQSKNLAPADKKLYALRDVTATIDSIPLIASSIMSKKLCADDDCIVLDVKCGSGAFCKTLKESKRLAKIMVEIGKNAGKKTIAVITNMNVPLGKNVGNSLEVIEAVNVLKGKGPNDLTQICIILASQMLYLSGKGSLSECELLVKESISSGKALETLIKMVKAQGGDESVIIDTEKFKKAKYKKVVKSLNSGYIYNVDAEGYGTASLILGAGRNTIEDSLDYSAGIILQKKVGDYVLQGEEIASIYSDNEKSLDTAEKKLLESTVVKNKKPRKQKLVLGIIK